jgi:hypothetical protein
MPRTFRIEAAESLTTRFASGGLDTDTDVADPSVTTT